MTRTKMVFDTDEVAHRWAHQLQESARNAGGNFYFDGNTIYSYGRHFPIAVIDNDKVLFNTSTYSNTTAKHIGIVRSAISHLDKIYCKNPSEAIFGNHTSNLNHWKASIESELNKMAKAKKPEIYAANIDRYRAELTEYITHFNLKLPSNIQELFSDIDNSGYKGLLAARIQKAKEKKAKIIGEGKPVFDAAIQAWREFREKEHAEKATIEQKNAYNTYVNMFSDSLPTNLRTDGKVIYTSKGMNMPVEIGQRYYEFYKRIVANGGCKGNCKYNMLGFEVNEANSQRLVVGCHNIPAEEIALIAEKLEWVASKATA